MKRTALLCGASCAAFLSVSGAFAQTTATSSVDEIVVRGYLLQNRDSIDAKRESFGIADFLSQDELGRQPDLNVADSLRRLPGVVTIFDEDEGRFVGLRGLDQRYTFISIDGSLIASTDRSDRDINIESIPPTAVKRLEVFKTPLADMDGQSVGGVINLVTRSAFDTDGLYAVANAQLGWHSQIGDLPESFENPSPRLDAAISHTFMDDTFGFLLSGTYFDKKRDQGRPILEGPLNDTGRAISRVLPLDYANRITRYNVLGKFEFRPNDQFYAYVQASHFDYQYDEVRTRLDFRLPPGDDLIEQGLSNQTATTGQFAEASVRARFDSFPLGQEIRNFQAFAEYRPTDRSLLEMTGSVSAGRQGHPYPNAQWSTPILPDFGYSYDLAGQDEKAPDVATIELNNPARLLDLGLYEFERFDDAWFENREDVTEFKMDYAWNTDGQDAGYGFKVGAKYRNLEKGRDDFNTRYTLADPSAVLPLENFVNVEQDRPYTEQYFNGLNYPVINAQEFYAYFAQNEGDFIATNVSSANAFYRVQEDVTALYALGTYNMGRHSVKTGLRFERTEVATIANSNNTVCAQENPDGSCAVDASFTAPFESEREYNSFLPSFFYSYDIGCGLSFLPNMPCEGMKARIGFSQAIGRPNHPDLAGAVTIDETAAPLPTIRRGNVDLEPRESYNYDIGFDYFIAPGQFFSIAGFYKDIDNQISRETDQVVIDGTLFEVSQPVNLDEVTVLGVEVSYTDDAFEFLPHPFDGFGVTVNGTYMDGNNELPDGREVGNLVSQPDFLVNAALLYNKGPFSAKVTYNYVDDRLTSVRGRAEDDRFEGAYDQLDLQVRWQLNDNFQVQFESRNLLNEPRTTIFRDGLVREINDFGNSYWLGVSYKY